MTTSRSIFILLVIGAAVQAQGPNELSRGVNEYHTWLHDAILSKSSSILVARVVKITELPNKERLATLEVRKTLFGRVAEQVTVIGFDGTFTAFADLEKLVFLEARGDAVIHTVVDFADLLKDDAAERISYVEAVLTAESHATGEKRMAAQRDLLMARLETSSAWVRRVLVRELKKLVSVRPGLFDGAAILTLSKFQFSRLDAADARRWQEAIATIVEANGIAFIDLDPAFKDQTIRKQFLEELAYFQKGDDTPRRLRFLENAARALGRTAAWLVTKSTDDRSDAVRETALRLLGDLEAVQGVPRLLATLDPRAKTPLKEKRAAVIALGRIGDPRAVKLLMESSGDVDLRLESLTALARINTADARFFLEDLDARLRRDERSPEDVRWHLQYLLSPRFPDDMRRERAERAKVYRLP